MSRTKERVEFKNQRGQKLVGLRCGPVQETMVISCHGMLSNKDGSKHQRLAQELEARDISMLRFDFAGRGESEGRLFDMTYSNERQDLEAAIEHLVAEGAQRFGVFGSSMGGAVAIITAARDERVVALATLAAVGHTEEVEERYPLEIKKWRRQGYIELEEGPLGVDFLNDALQHDVLSAMRVILAPILVVHGLEDEVVPVSDAHDIATAARNARLELVEGADHRFSKATHLRPTMATIADFFGEHLGPA